MITTKANEHRANIRKARTEKGQKFAVTSGVIYEGLSPVDNMPIVGIITNLNRASENRKTGDMAQVYILRADVRPVEAVATGADVSTCGNCPLRPTLATGAKCYVNTGWLGKLWDSIPNLPRLNPVAVGDWLESSKLELREGAYGDPAMIPNWIRRELNRGRGTSYTHQWNEPWIDPNASDYSMASVQTVDEKNAANAMGYRTYRVTSGDLEPDEILCPEITSGANCKDCGLCAGNRVQAKNIVIRPI
tara:strand:+ start:112 stop:855 length:744 start_codon:yes stop_codon:yes gene_type:complete